MTDSLEDQPFPDLPEDLEKFRKMYGITGEIEKEY